MFLSEKAESLLARYRKAAPSLNGDTAELLAEMASLLAEACVQIDMLALKADEVSEKVDQTTDHLEAVNSNLQTIRDRIVGEIRVDAPDYGEEEGADEDCGCDDEDNSNDVDTSSCMFGMTDMDEVANYFESVFGRPLTCAHSNTCEKLDCRYDMNNPNRK